MVPVAFSRPDQCDAQRAQVFTLAAQRNPRLVALAVLSADLGAQSAYLGCPCHPSADYCSLDWYLNTSSWVQVI